MKTKLKLDVMKNDMFYKTINVYVPFRLNNESGKKECTTLDLVKAAIEVLPSLKLCRDFELIIVR